jgi:tetratricopeptide (TPR) repeat protein
MLPMVAMACVVPLAALHAQGAIDPTVANRAAALERQGNRGQATEMLGRYLATAPDDGQAWFELGRFYLMDGRAWHQEGHIGDPDATIYLDFAATAFEQAIRLGFDTARVDRGMVEMDRAVMPIEEAGWTIPPGRGALEVPPLPAFVQELGRNIVRSCPARGVVVTGSDLEAVAAWYTAVIGDRRQDMVLVRPDLYATDHNYRVRMARMLEADSGAPLKGALAQAARHRPLCLAPDADDSLAGQGAVLIPWRMVRVVSSGAADSPTDALTVLDLLAVEQSGGAPWSAGVLEIYRAAARHNPSLCGGALATIDGAGAPCGR